MSSLLRSTFRLAPRFRGTLLSMLRPFDIAKLLLAMDQAVSEDEREVHMDPILDLLVDPAPLAVLRAAGARVIFIGKDLELLFDRLRHPARYLEQHGDSHVLNFLVAAFQDPEEGDGPMDKFWFDPNSYMGVPEDLLTMKSLMRGDVYPSLRFEPLESSPESATSVVRFMATLVDCGHRALFLTSEEARSLIGHVALTPAHKILFSEWDGKLKEPKESRLQDAVPETMMQTTDADVDFYMDNIVIEVGPGFGESGVSGYYRRWERSEAVVGMYKLDIRVV
ncbi:hypothetical protein FB567DRAFT_555805 [Paraphoma chrysanthemicola]|uniref:Uncharacterized protein n=1 Tax=Paraphoma chrysanthemicola TaxID=798071 RepID=A0A8K0VRV1_9PLEO|nr:hypothetical protein FB567DRAFT_555805 [Paraphoma chrysanthemicola]